MTQRSEEHTSELQSLRHLVCRLLLEKKQPLALAALLQPEQLSESARGALRCLAFGHAAFAQQTDLAAILQRVLLYEVVFFNDPATTEIYPLSLHDALPIYRYRYATLRPRWRTFCGFVRTARGV